jgi:hypothetical protein
MSGRDGTTALELLIAAALATVVVGGAVTAAGSARRLVRQGEDHAAGRFATLEERIRSDVLAAVPVPGGDQPPVILLSCDRQRLTGGDRMVLARVAPGAAALPLRVVTVGWQLEGDRVVRREGDRAEVIPTDPVGSIAFELVWRNRSEFLLVVRISGKGAAPPRRPFVVAVDGMPRGVPLAGPMPDCPLPDPTAEQHEQVEQEEA